MRTRIAALVEKTREAYSFDRYGEREWRRAIRLLIDKGLSDVEIEVIMRSKWTRWAADDCADKVHHRPIGEDLIRFMNDPRNWRRTAKSSAEAISELVKEAL